MKHLQLLLPLFLLLSISLPSSAQTQHDVNPVYIANLLTNSISTDEMRETCRFYHLFESTGEEGYTVFTDPHGNIIRFKMTPTGGNGNTDPLVELHTKDSKKTIEKILRDTGYRKHSDAYVHGTIHALSHTRCLLTSSDTHHILTFLKVHNNNQRSDQNQKLKTDN